MTTLAWTPDFDALPLCGSVAHWARQFRNERDWPSTTQLNALAAAQSLCNGADRPVCFVEQTAACGQRDYEQQIWDSGQVPTRAASAHDFFNALIWLTFPQTKATLNAVQCRELANAPKGQRSPASNAATLFDESGLVLVARDAELAELLRAKQWKAAFWERRARWHDARFYVIGHALLEKAVWPSTSIEDAGDKYGQNCLSAKADIGAADVKPAPAGGRRQKAIGSYPGMTGKCLFLQVDALPEAGPPPATLDTAIARAWLDGTVQKPTDLFVIPVLGVPSFDEANTEAAYYDNTEVFRPPRNAPGTE